MEKKKAILVWSDGINMHSHTFTGADDMSAFEEAQKQMHKEYDDRSTKLPQMKNVGPIRAWIHVCTLSMVRITVYGIFMKFKKETKYVLL